MEKGNTKQEILDASLELFSIQGFEATSISQIANAVGIRKASLYSRFENKQAILDALVKEVLDRYAAHSIFAKTDWENDAVTKNVQALTPDAAAQMIQGQIRSAHFHMDQSLRPGTGPGGGSHGAGPEAHSTVFRVYKK